MNRYRHRDGDERIWITPNEMEDLMSAELIKAGLMPKLSDPVVDLATFVEQHLKAKFDSYAPLDSAVLGETEFRVGARPKVSINKDLTGAALDDDEIQPGILGRWRATVAHEATHVIVHRCLFNLNEDQGSLFAELEAAEPEVKHLQRCMKRDVLFRGSGTSDWREIQANMGKAWGTADAQGAVRCCLSAGTGATPSRPGRQGVRSCFTASCAAGDAFQGIQAGNRHSV